VTARTTTRDRDFEKSVGIKTSCDMCDLLHIENQREKDTVLDREIRLLFLVRLMFHHKRETNMWKLAAFAGLAGTLLFAWGSLHHG